MLSSLPSVAVRSVSIHRISAPVEHMLLAIDVVQAVLSVHRQVAICELIAGKTLMSGDPGAFENLSLIHI